jgi:hypothetical protein
MDCNTLLFLKIILAVTIYIFVTGNCRYNIIVGSHLFIIPLSSFVLLLYFVLIF